MTPDPQRTAEVVIVQTARTLPTADSGWTTQRWLYFAGGSEGAGTVLGDATLVQAYGVIQAEQGRQFVSVGALPDTRRTGSGESLVGQLVRLLKLDTAGTVTIGSRRFTPFWWGQITGQQTAPDGASGTKAGGSVAFTCAGMLSLLDQIQIGHGWIRPASGTTAVKLGRMPKLNDTWPATNGAILDGTSIAAGFYNTAGSTPQTAANLIQTLLTGYATLSAGYGGLPWALAIVSSCLNYVPPAQDWNGLTVLQAIEQIAGAARGIVYRCTVSAAGVPTITFQSASAEAIVMASYTLPASTDTVAFNATNLPNADEVVFAEDQSSTADIIIVRGARPIRGITLAYDPAATGTCALVRTANLGSAADPLVFSLNAAWSGLNHDGQTGLRGTLTPATTAEVAAYGNAGLTGARAAGGYGSTAKPTAGIELLDYLRISDNGSTKQIKPILSLRNGSTVYGPGSIQTKGWTVDILNDPPAIAVDDGAGGRALQLFLDAGYSLLVTLSVLEVDPLQVSWIRSSSDQPRAAARVRVIDLPEIDDVTLAPGTLSVPDAPGSGSGATTIVDGLPRLRAALALARARFAIPDFRLTYRDRGILDTDATGRPGQLVTTVHRGDQAQTVNVTLTRRRWVLSRDENGEWWDTLYEASRVLPEIGAVL